MKNSFILYDNNEIKPEIHSKRDNENSQRLNTSLLNDECITEQIEKPITLLLELNENKQRIYPSQHAVPRSKAIALSAYIRKSEEHQIIAL